MVTRLERQQEIFGLIGKKLKKKIECFAIGGSALLYHGAKESTKDIDIVFSREEDQREIVNILKEEGFAERNAKILYFEKKNIPILLQRGEDRLDLFCKEIVCFKLTDSIVDRAEAVYEYDNLIVKVIAPEDIIQLKCATERAGDRIDAAELIKKFKIDWDTIIKESQHQTGLGEDIFPVYLFDFLSELKEDLKADIPNNVLKEIRKIGEKAMIKLMKEKKLVKTKRFRK